MTMTATIPSPEVNQTAGFTDGILYQGVAWDRFDELGAEPVLTRDDVEPASDAFAYQTALAADALRYLTLQVAAGKGSGHPGGFCSSAEVHASLFMLGFKNLFTEVGHHAPGFYSALFLDRSLEKMGIHTVADFAARFREQHGLLGHPSGAVPGISSPGGPLGQGQHFAMAAALLHPGMLFPVTIGDGGMGEPYVLSAFKNFSLAFPDVTNHLPILIWNGFSQEHHSMVCGESDEAMSAAWRAAGFEKIILVDAKPYDDASQPGAFVDSTRFRLDRRISFTAAVIEGLREASASALGGTRTLFLLKQIKGAGSHALGSKSHHLYPQFTLDHPDMIAGMERRALHPEAWKTVRANFERAGGGAAADVAITETERPLPPLPSLPWQELAVGDIVSPTTAVGPMVVAVGRADAAFIAANADGNEASGVRNISDGLLIRHPVEDPLYSQGPQGRVYEPISEDACAGLTGALALLGSRSLWLSYESFAVNGLPFFQSVTQAMAELRRRTPSAIALFTACAIEQGRNGWTHQRPEVEGYFAAMLRNGNVYPIFPCDAQTSQAAYEWALNTRNKGVALFASKSPLPVRTTREQAVCAVENGTCILSESPAGKGPWIVFGVLGDMVLAPVFEAAQLLEADGMRVRIISIINPRRLYRAEDVYWQSVSEPDGKFLDDTAFDAVFGGDALIGVSGGASALLEPLLLRGRAPRDVFAWKRGDTTASPSALMQFNGLTGTALAERARKLVFA